VWTSAVAHIAEGTIVSMLKKWSIRTFAVIGALAVALAIYVLLASLLARARERSPDPGDLAYVLSWAEIGHRTRVTRIDCAYASRRNWLAGDQTKVYIFRVSPVPESVFVARDNHFAVWKKGPFTESLYARALETAVVFAQDTPCVQFPTLGTLNSSRFYVSFQEIAAHHGRLERVIVTAYDTRAATIHHADITW
jgi:hypothetical protein